MKKVLLTGAALMAFAAAGFAQNTSTVNQNGTSQTANATQVGNQQTSTINQTTGSATGANANYGNFGATFQGMPGSPNNTGPNMATINQNDGSQGNRAGATQSGDKQTSTINQNGGADGISGGSSSAATLNSASGNGNFAGTKQQGSLGTAMVNQNNNSSSNFGEVRQNGGGTTINTGTVNQSNTSKSNYGQIYQGYTAPDNPGAVVNNDKATINQGKTNAADLNYTPGVAAESLNNQARITQTASDNTASIDQGASAILDPFSPISAGR